MALLHMGSSSGDDGGEDGSDVLGTLSDQMGGGSQVLARALRCGTKTKKESGHKKMTEKNTIMTMRSGTS